MKLDDNKWCRGITEDVSSDVVSFKCPDSGKQQQIAITNVRIPQVAYKWFYVWINLWMVILQVYPLPPELCVYWYQAFECALHNLNSDCCLLLTDEKFKEDYEGSELLMYIDDIENGRWVTKNKYLI